MQALMWSRRRLLPMVSSVLVLFVAVSVFVTVSEAGADNEPLSVGVAKVDVTPEGPIRLHGYRVRKKESTGVAQKLWAKALAIGNDSQGPAVLITVDNCMVPAEVTEEVARRLAEKVNLPRERFVVSTSHTHAGPCLEGAAPFIFGEPIPPEHKEKIRRYTRVFTDHLEEVALAALSDRQPSRLAWGRGQVHFAVNRRVLKNGKWAGFGVNSEGPVDHDLPVLVVTDLDGELRAVLANYACHATTVKSYDVHGDWPGSAQLAIEAEHPNATAMISIGCGGDMNPQPFAESAVDRHGEAIAAEVERILAGKLQPITAPPACRLAKISIPLDDAPSREQWEERAAGTGRQAYYARIVLERMDRGIQPPTSFPYQVQTWTFGDDLAMVFLAGEVVVDYALRLKKELGDDLWVTAYANDVPCYIVSRRILNEGGYEVDESRASYDKPARLAPEAENLIVETVQDLLPRRKKSSREDSSADAVKRPNILWITCEDMSPNMGCYGDDYATTPNLDRVADQGVRYTNAFSHTGVCAPSRSGLITGMYPTSLGSHHMRCSTTLPDFVKCLPEYLREIGYYCTNQSKTDYNFPVPANAWDVSRGAKAHWRNRGDRQPFFSVFNLTITHESRIRANYDSLEHDPDAAVLPPYLPDTPVVRRDWARYHDLITQMDARAGKILAQLEEDGLADDTIVFFFSDHGVGLPRAKQWIYDAGTQVPFIVRFPPQYRHLAPAEPGSTVDRLISFVDVAPSVLSLVGLEIPRHVQGVPFLGPRAAEPRRYIHGVRDRMDERYDMNRTVRDDHYKYHRNYFPERPFAPWLSYMEKLDTMQEWRRLDAAGELSGVRAFFMRDTKPVEELYDIQADPHEQVNLADRAEYQDALERLREAHFEWVRRTIDLGFLPEQEMRDRSGAWSEFEMARQGPDVLPFERIVEAAWLSGEPAEALDRLLEMSRDKDPAVRFWAVIGLINSGSREENVAAALHQTLRDPCADVRIVAAEALCRIDQPDTALPVLTAALEHESRWVRLRAANVLDRIGEKARPVLDVIRKTVQDQSRENLFVRWVLEHTLAQLGE